MYNNGVKNFYPIVKAVGHDGISAVTNMNDGTITTSGTSAIANVIHLAQVSFPTNIQVKISGAPSGANGSRKLQLADITNNYSIEAVDQGSGVTATLTANHVYEIRIFYAAGINMDGLVWKPMMTLASCPNSDYAHYVPYAQSNAALTEKCEVSLPTFLENDHHVLTASDYNLHNCTGTIDSFLYYQVKNKKLVIYGRIHISDFVKTSSPEGVKFSVPNLRLKNVKGYINGYSSINGNIRVGEMVILQAFSSSNEIIITVTETYSNMPTSQSSVFILIPPIMLELE